MSKAPIIKHKHLIEHYQIIFVNLNFNNISLNNYLLIKYVLIALCVAFV